MHSDIVAQAQACRHCTEKGKNLKPLIHKTQVGNLPPLSEPNEEVQIDFAGPIPFKDNALFNYLLVTVDTLSRYPHAEVFNNCDSKPQLNISIATVKYMESLGQYGAIKHKLSKPENSIYTAKTKTLN